jgi:hypothetical protein
MDKILADLLQTFRSVARRRLSTLTIVGVFGLGCGASTAIFALADPVLLRPLPYADPDALMVAEFGRETNAEAAPTLRALQNRGEVFDGVGAFRLGEVLRVRTHTGTAALRVVHVSPDYFAVLRTELILSPSWGTGRGDVPIVLTASGSAKLGGDEKEAAQADVASRIQSLVRTSPSRPQNPGFGSGSRSPESTRGPARFAPAPPLRNRQHATWRASDIQETDNDPAATLEAERLKQRQGISGG